MVKDLNKLSDLEKWGYYIQYFTTQYKIKHSVSIKDVLDKDYDEFMWNKPDSICHNLHFRYLWKDSPNPISFEKFCQNTSNIDSLYHWCNVINYGK